MVARPDGAIELRGDVPRLIKPNARGPRDAIRRKTIRFRRGGLAGDARPQRWSVPAVERCTRCRSPSSSFARSKDHRDHHPPNAVQLSTLLSIKTGGCPEDCGYCPQAKRYHTGVTNEALLDVAAVLAAARAAKAQGATRFCMGAAWRGPKDRDLPRCSTWSAGSRRWEWRRAARSAC